MFTFLTVREWDRLLAKIERAGLLASHHGDHDLCDDLTQLAGELVTGWQAEFYAADPASYERPAGSDHPAPVGTEPGAFPVMGDRWPAGSGPAVPPRSLHDLPVFGWAWGEDGRETGA
jgi:hypothetical protein